MNLRMDSGAEVARILVTVKTYPNPSDAYGETVCVAGVRLDGGPRWIRLYPTLYRHVDYGQRFKKYEIIEVPVVPHGSKDPRPESHRPLQEGLTVIRKVDTKTGWRERKDLLGNLVGAVTTCELIRVNRETKYNKPAPSLGLVKMLDPEVSVLPGDPWSESQLAKAVRAASPTLFNPEGFKQLEPAPYRVRFRYRCAFEKCAGHEPALLDWEAGEAGRKWRREYGPSEALDKLREKYEKLLVPDKDSHLYIGNLHQHRTSFSALGVWYPPKVPCESDLYESDLFSF